MVALAPNTSETSPWDVLDTFPKLHSRAREANTRSCTEAPHSKSFGRVEIWLMIYEGCGGLESFTRDPIGYDGSPFNLYDFVDSQPVFKTDPSGQSVCDGYDDYDDPSPCFPQSLCWMRFPRWPYYLPWTEEDNYPSLAKKCCEAFGRLYGRNPTVQCVGDCLITHEQCCQKKIGCDDRQRCRTVAHIDCYVKCVFVPYLGMPWDCLAITDDVLNL